LGVPVVVGAGKSEVVVLLDRDPVGIELGETIGVVVVVAEDADIAEAGVVAEPVKLDNPVGP
jgi:hypothetical protein